MKAKAFQGEIELIDFGDCDCYNLIVSGKCRGEVWNFSDVGVQLVVNGRTFWDGLSCGQTIKIKRTISKTMYMKKISNSHLSEEETEVSAWQN